MASVFVVECAGFLPLSPVAQVGSCVRPGGGSVGWVSGLWCMMARWLWLVAGGRLMMRSGVLYR